jgi:enoyl-CoA hydratase/carnithine racemase
LGEPVNAQRALALGLVNRVVPADELLPAALRLAQSLAQVSRPAMQLTKQLFHEAADLPLAQALERGREANKRMRAFRKP